MSQTIIRASVVDQRLQLTESPLLASGGQNEAVVAFDFCEKWDGYTKTGVFYRDEEEVYHSLLDENDTCVIPWEVYTEPGYFYFNVFGNKDDVRRTSSTVRYRAQKGIVSDNMLPSEPSPSVYEQILSAITHGTSSKTATIFNSVAEMVNSTDLFKGATAQTLGFYEVNDGGGAMYAITEDEGIAANGANLIQLNDGLVAVLLADVANIKQYGGKALPSFDNTAVFNIACASGKDVFIPNGNFGIHGRVIVPDGGSRRISGEEMGAGGANLYMTANAYFDVTEESVFFNGIRFVAVKQEHKNGYRCIEANPLNGLDADVWIENCIFSWFEYPLRCNGRGLQVHNSQFLMCGDSCVYNYIGTTDGGLPTVDTISGGRALAVTNCRFHSITPDRSAIKILEGSVVFNPLIVNCQMDTGQGNFLMCQGDIYGGVIDGNIIGMATTNSFQFSGKVENVTVSNNAVMNYNHRYGGGYPTAIFRVDGSYCSGLTISDNVFFGCKMWCIVFASSADKLCETSNCKIIGNTFDTVGMENNATYAPILVSGNTADHMVVANNIVKNTPPNVLYLFRGSIVNAITDSIVLGNVMPSTMIAAMPNTVPSDQNVIQDELENAVKSVNGVSPDANGNVEIEVGGGPGGSAYTDTVIVDVVTTEEVSAISEAITAEQKEALLNADQIFVGYKIPYAQTAGDTNGTLKMGFSHQYSVQMNILAAGNGAGSNLVPSTKYARTGSLSATLFRISDVNANNGFVATGFYYDVSSAAQKLITDLYKGVVPINGVDSNKFIAETSTAFGIGSKFKVVARRFNA